jgi:hypothetical protein
VRTTALLSTARAARIARAGRAASSGRRRLVFARPCCVYRQQQQLRRLFQFRRRGASSQRGGWAQQQSLPAPARGCCGTRHQLPEAAGESGARCPAEVKPPAATGGEGLLHKISPREAFATSHLRLSPFPSAKAAHPLASSAAHASVERGAGRDLVAVSRSRRIVSDVGGDRAAQSGGDDLCRQSR